MAKASKRSKAKDRTSARAAKQKKVNMWTWLIGAGVAAAIIVPIAVNLVSASSLPGESFRSQGNAHIELGSEHPAYNSNPPTSGWHTGDLTGWGSYDYVVPDERVIHNMEDGGVILWYKLGTAEENEENIKLLEEAIEVAEEETSERFRHVVIMPRKDMETPYAMTAWTRLQRLEAFDQGAITKFLESYEGIDHHVRGYG